MSNNQQQGLKQAAKEALKEARHKALQEQLKFQEALYKISCLKEWKEFLKPYLLTKVNNQWLKPEEFDSLDKFHKAYVEARADAVAVTTIINLIETSEQSIINLNKQINADTKAFGL